MENVLKRMDAGVLYLMSALCAEVTNSYKPV